MNRRSFIKAAGVAAVGAEIAPSGAPELSYLTTAEYNYIFADFKKRHPLEYNALRQHSWMISDLVWEGEDAHYPDHVQHTKEWEREFKRQHGWEYSYYWRGHLELARKVLRGDTPMLGRLLLRADDVTIWSIDECFISLIYAFRNRGCVGGVQW